MFILSIEADHDEADEVARLLRLVADDVEAGVRDGAFIDGHTVRFLYVSDA